MQVWDLPHGWCIFSACVLFGFCANKNRMTCNASHLRRYKDRILYLTFEMSPKWTCEVVLSKNLSLYTSIFLQHEVQLRLDIKPVSPYKCVYLKCECSSGQIDLCHMQGIEWVVPPISGWFFYQALSTENSNFVFAWAGNSGFLTLKVHGCYPLCWSLQDLAKSSPFKILSCLFSTSIGTIPVTYPAFVYVAGRG